MKAFELTKSDKKLAVLIDPDKHSIDELVGLVSRVEDMAPDFLFFGGSLMTQGKLAEAARMVKMHIKRPLVLFPGHLSHLTDAVDAVLLLSLVSGRNPELLIGQHVVAAPVLKSMSAEIISTAYLLIDGGNPTSVSYMSQTQPIPRDKSDIAMCTALAGELIGMKQVYLDAGSGASKSISTEMVRTVANAISIPLIVGGGIRTLESAEAIWQAGANLVVIGNAFEQLSIDEQLELADGLKQARNL